MGVWLIFPQAWVSNGKIYFRKEPGNYTTAGEVWSMNSDGTSPTQITSRASGTLWSADVYTSQ